MNVRIPEHIWNPLQAQLLASTEVETAGLLMGPCTKTAGGSLIAIRQAVSIPDDAYRVRARDQLSIDPVAMNRLTRPARDRGWSIFTIHTHPGATEAWFSLADDAGDARLMPALHNQIPVPHGSMVLASSGALTGRVFDGVAAPLTADVSIVGRTLQRQAECGPEAVPWFSRQILALGASGQARIRKLRVAVVGLGGIGSLVSMQLAHLGVGELVLIDGDIVEASNLSRIVGAQVKDIGRTSKVDVAARYIEVLGLGTRVFRVPDFCAAHHEELLASCDIIVSCVDQVTPRALLNRLAYRHVIPLVDLGVVFRVDGAGAIIGDAGRVVIVGPGRPCLACWGHLDPEKLRRESLSQEDRQREIDAGYLDGADEAQPSVIAFNTSVAGAGVVEVMRLVTGFAGTEAPPMRTAFSFSEGTVRRNTVQPRHNCAICQLVGDF